MSSHDPTSLAAVCRAHPLRAKRLIAPSYRVGHQWIERLVRDGQPVVNLMPTTIERAAFDLIVGELLRDGLTLIGSDAGPLIVQQLLEELPVDGYFRRSENAGEFAAVLYRSLMDLRLAGVDAAELNAAQFESPAKAKDVGQLLAAYERFLREHSLVDQAEVLRLAAEYLKQRPGVADALLYLLPSDIPISGLERHFLEALPAESRIVVRHPVDVEDSHGDVRLLAQLGEHAAIQPREPNGCVRFFRAFGEVNEGRDVLRRILAEVIPLDEVEVLHTDAETYVPLFYSLSKRYFADPDRPSGIPMTFAEGLPVMFSRPGRALALWLRWMEEGFPQGLLVEMFANGLVEADDGDFGHGYLAQLLRAIPIGGQAENYLPKLDARIKALQLDVPTDPDYAAARERELKALKELRKVVARILKLSKSLQAATTVDGLTACEEFLSKVARSVNELDRYATEAILEQIAQQRFWLERLRLKVNLRDLIPKLLAQLRVLGSGPRPGHLHVASLDAGGNSGRRETFVVGLDDRRFPGAGYQDPVLLDRERTKLSDQLPLSAAQLEQRAKELGQMLARQRGSVTLSWSCHDLVADRATFPASAALATYRLISGQPVDLHGLDQATGTPVSFAPQTAEHALDESDWWLWKLSDPAFAGQNQRQLVKARYSHLARGADAAAQRSEFGDYNGCVPQAGADANPFAEGAAALAASALENAGRCPRLYFFRHVLKLYPPDEHELDYDQWLSAAQFGQLMHEIFRRFMSELAAANERPQFDRHHHRLAALVQEVCDAKRVEIPPASANAFRTQLWRILRTAKVFLDNEETHCRASQPRYFEVAIGADPVGDGTPLDDAAPVAIALPGGERILLRGQVDRIDELAAASFGLWDYKISSGYGYDAADPFRQGRRVQNALYLHLIESALQSKHDPHARVASFGYFFPSVKARGLRIEWPAAALAAGLTTVERLCQLIAAGAFPATSSRDDCTFCDYQNICGDVGAVTAASQELLDRTDLVPLAPYRELRRG